MGVCVCVYVCVYALSVCHLSMGVYICASVEGLSVSLTSHFTEHSISGNRCVNVLCVCACVCVCKSVSHVEGNVESVQ